MRVVTYARASTTRQENSIQDQQVITRKYIIDKKYEMIDEISDVASGRAIKNRKGLALLKKAISDRRCDIVLVNDISRLGRNLRHLLAFFEYAKQRNVSIHAVNVGEITQFHITALGLVAQMQIEVGIDQIRRSHHANIIEGLRAGKGLYGYRPTMIDGKNGHLRIEDEEAEVVRRAFKLAADGLSLTDICGIFNAEKIAAPNGGVWRAHALSRKLSERKETRETTVDGVDVREVISADKKIRVGILHNTTYYGVNTYGKTRLSKDVDTETLIVRINDSDGWLVFPGKHEAIISKELFDKVQEVRDGFELKQNKISRGPTRLLSGLIRCEKCGSSMIRMGRGRDPSSARIICTNAVFKQGCNNNRTYYVNRIEEVTVQALINFLASDAATVEKYLERHRIERRAAMKAARSDIAKIRAQADEDRIGIQNLITALKHGGDPGILNPEITKLNKRISESETLLSEAIASGVIFQIDRATLASLHEELSRLGSRLMSPTPDPADAEIIARFRSLIERVVPISPGKHKNGFSVEVYGRLAQIVSGDFDPIVLSSTMLQSFKLSQMEKAKTLAHAKINETIVLIASGRSASLNNLESLNIHQSVVEHLMISNVPQSISQITEMLDLKGDLASVGVSAQRLRMYIGKLPNIMHIKGFGYWLKDRSCQTIGYDPSVGFIDRRTTHKHYILKKGLDDEAAISEIIDIIISANKPLSIGEIVAGFSERGVFPHLQDCLVAMPSLIKRNRTNFVSLRLGRYWPQNLDNEYYNYHSGSAINDGVSTELKSDLKDFRSAALKVLQGISQPLKTEELHVALSIHGYKRRSTKSLKMRAELSGLFTQLKDGRWWHSEYFLPIN